MKARVKHVKAGDTVKVLAGKDKGKTGKVIQVFSSQNKVVVEGLNTMKKHVRPQNRGEKGQVIELSAPMHASNVKKIDAKDVKKPTKKETKKTEKKEEKSEETKK